MSLEYGISGLVFKKKRFYSHFVIGRLVQNLVQSYNEVHVMSVINVSSKNLRMLVDGYKAKLVWGRKIFNDIYELSFEFGNKGYQTWYAQAKEEGGFDLISCSMYLSLETIAIKLKEEQITNDADL